MNRRDFALDQYQLDALLSPFRSKHDVVKFWMQAYQVMINYSRPDPDDVIGTLSLCVDKMQRLFVQYGDKSFSTSFPISIREREGSLFGQLRSGQIVSPKDASEILAVINNSEAFHDTELLELIDEIEQHTDDLNRLSVILGELILAEDGYLRVDYDEILENGDLHPLNHIDVCYSQSATFKLGLTDKMDVDEFTDMLNLNSNCHYLYTSQSP